MHGVTASTTAVARIPSRGALFSRVNRSVDDPNVIAVVAGFETLKGFVNDPALEAAMIAAGVQGSPRIEIYEEVEVI